MYGQMDIPTLLNVPPLVEMVSACLTLYIEVLKERVEAGRGARGGSRGGRRLEEREDRRAVMRLDLFGMLANFLMFISGGGRFPK